MSPTARRPGAPRRALFPCLVLLTALGALDQTMMATALPDVVTDLGDAERAAWPVTAYTLALTSTMPAAGALGDRVGRRRTLLASIAVFVLGSIACGLADDMTALTLARLVQGVGGAGLLTLPQAVVADAVPVRDRAAYLGPLGAVFAVATVVSPLLGGWLTDTASWRWIFWVNLPLGAAAAVLVVTAVPAAPAGRTHSERRAGNPALRVQALRHRTVLLCCLLALLAGFGLFGVLAYIPAWIQGMYGTSASVAGLMLLPVTLGIVIGTNASGLAVRRWGHWRAFPVVGCALSAAAAATLAVIAGRMPPLPVVAGLLAVLALGTGLFMQLIVVAAQDAGPSGATGKVTASLAFVREIGVLTGTAVLGSLAAHGLAAAPGRAAGAAFAPVLVVTAACFLSGLALAFLLPRHRLGESDRHAGARHGKHTQR
ncbi:MFS transporter [Streptomyces sp. NPDC050315]|uniref:MFS transporter n=1 Tax=Streptomyces sp. NPDC050315 TaxID=3155039 RepID=UPI003447BB25